jgi:hypothetical protein
MLPHRYGVNCQRLKKGGASDARRGDSHRAVESRRRHASRQVDAARPRSLKIEKTCANVAPPPRCLVKKLGRQRAPRSRADIPRTEFRAGDGVNLNWNLAHHAKALNAQTTRRFTERRTRVWSRALVRSTRRSNQGDRRLQRCFQRRLTGRAGMLGAVPYTGGPRAASRPSPRGRDRSRGRANTSLRLAASSQRVRNTRTYTTTPAGMLTVSCERPNQRVHHEAHCGAAPTGRQKVAQNCKRGQKKCDFHRLNEQRQMNLAHGQVHHHRSTSLPGWRRTVPGLG